MINEHYKRLKELIGEKGLTAVDLMDVMPDEALKEVCEYWEDHCICGGTVQSEYEEFVCVECR